ncbi:MAG TPA: MarR family transcriptional regulator [Frateuria sp.]|uniref:MarR family winged helix-turn-helix transcriptional regulator n=1 Tax=Frateuria sp. TaxID=2211372 RepID=UPI002D80B281|nr:MarR family transcriptional regulator [Frateuria sp.]HET6804122.1 MarR family transcriptional regulator [Frateuria sp.]
MTATRVHLALLQLERLHKDLNRSIDRVLVPEELALAEWLIIAELANGDAPLTQVARRLARDPGSLSRATTRLIKRGLLHSARHERDRRRATLGLTAGGRVLHGRVAVSLDLVVRRAPSPQGLPIDRLLWLLEATRGSSAALPVPLTGEAAADSPQRHADHAPPLENDP